ncbi:MAG: LPS export ABC transporter periplasmic protein LptC [Acidobacteria bacterium]|nr:LPS export ABC transporter periplasmic protein LptC [Acidobacteriota bacterium]
MHLRSVRLLQRGLGVLIAVVLLWVVADYLLTWRNRIRAVRESARILGSEMIRSAEDLEYSENENGKLRFKIHASKLLETRQGKNFLEGIEAFDFNPDGSQRNRIQSRRAEYDREAGHALFVGDVQIQMAGGIELRTSSLHYDLRDNRGWTDDTMHLTSPQASGSARGVRYDYARRILELQGDVDLELVRKAQGPASPAVEERSHIVSDLLYYSEADRFAVFRGNARLQSANAYLSGREIEVRLSEDRRHLSSLMSAGDAEYRSSQPDSVEVLAGDRLDFVISPLQRSLERIMVNGNARFDSERGNDKFRLKGAQIQLVLGPGGGSLEKISSLAGAEFESWRGGSNTAISGEELEADFSRQTRRLQSLSVRRNAQMALRPGAGQPVDELRADRIRFEFVEIEGESRPRRLQAEGCVRWISAPREAEGGKASASGRMLAAERMEMRYLPSGESLEEGDASGNVRITLLASPADTRPPVRSLEAEQVKFAFHQGGNRLRSLDGEGKVRVVYQAAVRPQGETSAAEAFETHSQRLLATFRESDGAAEEVRQSGGFFYRDGNRTARSGESSYEARTETLVMTGSPEVVDTTTRTAGTILEYQLRDKIITVRKDVRSVFFPAPHGNGGTPFLASSGTGAPTVVTAQRMLYWTETSRVEYSGGVSMLSEESQLRAQRIEILDSGNELAADGGVFHRIERRSEAPESGRGESHGTAASRDSRKDASPLVIRCRKLRYEKARNMIGYEQDVALESGDLRLWSERLDAMLDEDAGRIEWAKASGRLRIKQSGREARGEQADYFLAPGKFVVVGNPAEITDPVRGKSAARRLTFFSLDDRILLEKS